MRHNLSSHLNNLMLNQLSLYTFAKDRKGRFVSSNDNFAMIAGFDSPHQIVGKRDTDLVWRNQAESYLKGDFIAMNGERFINVQEPLPLFNTTLDILVSKHQLKNKLDRCIGVVASFIEVTGKILIDKSGFFDRKNKRYYLGSRFGNVYLTQREIQILQYVFNGYTAKHIARTISLSPRTVETHIVNIRRKLQANSKGDLIHALVSNGLTQFLFPRDLSNSLSHKF